MTIRPRLALAAVATSAAIFVGVKITQTPAPTPQGQTVARQTHASLDRIRDKPMAFQPVSAQMFVKDANPRGWSYEFGTRIETEGWGVILPIARVYAAGGHKILWLWEPVPQWDGIGDCMAWVSAATIGDGWSPKMKETWLPTLKEIRGMGMDVAWYSGCASTPNIGSTLEPFRLNPPFSNSKIHYWVDGVAACVEHDVHIVGLDAFSWLIYTNPEFSRAIIEAIRTDPRTKDVTLVTEGWLPKVTQNGRVLTNAERAFFLRHMGLMELIRGSATTRPTRDTNWSRLEPEEERRLMPGTVGIVFFHGSMWPKTETDAVYARVKAMGYVPLTPHPVVGEWR